MGSLKLLLLGLFLVLAILGWPVSGDGPICPKTDTLSRASFPKGFMFGTASAAFQVEGATDVDCRGPSVWDIYCKKYPQRCSGDNGDMGTDFYHRYKEDIKIMKDLNTDAFRLSISWPRIFPHGRKEKGINKFGVKFYHDLIDELIKNDLTPLVTVFHWDTPSDLEDEYGGFLSQNIVPDFMEYAEFVFNEYGDKVKNWITFNEPWVFSRAGYDEGKKAPGRCSKYQNEFCQDGRSGYEAYLVSHNLLIAHAEAVNILRTKCEKCKGARVGIAHSPAWFEPHDFNDAQDGASIDRALDFMMGWHLDTTTFGDYPQRMKDIVGHRLPKFTSAQKEKLKNSADFVGINYYTSKFANYVEKPDPSKPSWIQDSLTMWEEKSAHGFAIGSKPSTAALEVYSRGLRKLLKYIKDKYNNPEVIITENGYGEHFDDQDTLENGIKDYNRRIYLMRHLLSLYEAICEDGVNVTSYFHWALTDNFEWQNGYKHRFGLYHIDFNNNLTRTEKESGKYYKHFLSQGTPPSKLKKDEL